MAEAKKRRVLKKTETVREKAEKQASPKKIKSQRLHKATKSLKRPIHAARRIGRKEYHPIKLPDNKLGIFLTKTRRFTPQYFRDSWAELKQVTWPNRKDTINLSLAVFAFAIIFSLLIGVVDYGLDKLFKALLLN